MNCIHVNKVNKISNLNSPHDKLNPPKRTKTLNIYYSPILNICMNTRKGKEKFNKFQILFNSGCSSTIVMVRLI